MTTTKAAAPAQKNETKKAKAMTNEKLIRKFFGELDSIEVAFLRERILHVAEVTKKSIKEEPEKWQPGIVGKYSSLCSKIDKYLAFATNPQG